MLEFYYDAVLGLQYFSLNVILKIDLSVIPKGMNVDDFVDRWKKHQENKGIELCSSDSVVEHKGIISNLFL